MINIQDYFNFNDSTKKNVSEDKKKYITKTNDNSNYSPALNQGQKFKKYQSKIKNNLEKKINYVNSKEGFELLENDDLQLSENGPSVKTRELIEKNDVSAKESIVNNLRRIIIC
jgi:hypothetical protein